MDAGKTCVVVLVEGLPTDPSGACSACAVVSRIPGKHTGVSGCPDVMCYLTLHGATQHANRFQPLFGKRGGIKCHISERYGLPSLKVQYLPATHRITIKLPSPKGWVQVRLHFHLEPPCSALCAWSICQAINRCRGA